MSGAWPPEAPGTNFPPQPAVLPTLSLTQTQRFTALRSFLLGVLPPGTAVVRAQVNRVAQPAGSNYVVMTQLFHRPLATNQTNYFDNVVVGSIDNTTLTVTAVTQGALSPGVLLLDSVWPTMNIAVGTTIVSQLTGETGGVGTYQVSSSQLVGSETIYAGQRVDLLPAQWTVQVDVYGPASADNAQVIETLFRSEYATDAFGSYGYDVQPLYCDDAHQVPLIDAEQQFEERWTLDLNLQFNALVGTSQQFATEAQVETIEAAVVYTG